MGIGSMRLRAIARNGPRSRLLLTPIGRESHEQPHCRQGNQGNRPAIEGKQRNAPRFTSLDMIMGDAPHLMRSCYRWNRRHDHGREQASGSVAEQAGKRIRTGHEQVLLKQKLYIPHTTRTILGDGAIDVWRHASVRLSFP